MRATLIFNATAGGASGVSSDDVQAALVDAGISPFYRATSSEDDLDRALEATCEMVVVAGGDGTVRSVASRLAGRGIPLAVIPMGTANNIAASLGLTGGALDVARGLREPLRRPFDLGVVRAPWGKDCFLEAAGAGVFASVLSAYDPDAGKSPLRALTSLVSTLSGYEPHDFGLRLDGEELAGQFMLVEVMNTPAAGPRLRLAPGASPSDGLLDVVTVSEDARVGLTSYLGGLVTGRLEELPNVTVRQVRSLEIAWDGSPFHLDAVMRPPSGSEVPPGEIRVEVLAGALEVLTPPALPDDAAVAVEAGEATP